MYNKLSPVKCTLTIGEERYTGKVSVSIASYPSITTDRIEKLPCLELCRKRPIITKILSYTYGERPS